MILLTCSGLVQIRLSSKEVLGLFVKTHCTKFARPLRLTHIPGIVRVSIYLCAGKYTIICVFSSGLGSFAQKYLSPLSFVSV